MNYSNIFSEEIFENVVRELKEDCKTSRGFTSQIAGSNAFSAASTAIITYTLSKLGCLTEKEKRYLEQIILSYKISENGFYCHSIGNPGSVTVWSTAQSCLALIEIGTKKEMYADSVEWLCNVQSKNGGWSFNGMEDEPNKIGYCLYAVMVLNKISDKNSKIKDALSRAKLFIENYDSENACERLIKYFLSVLLEAGAKDEAEEKKILADFISENINKLYNYSESEPGSGEHHFYVPWYIPAFYMFFRCFLKPNHPVALFLMRLLLDNIIDGKGWSVNIHNDKIYSWATALSILSIDFWNKDCKKNSVTISQLKPLNDIKKQLLLIKEDGFMPAYMDACPLNGGKCTMRSEIKLEYDDKNIFLDIPYQNAYLTFEDQIKQTIAKSGLNAVIAKGSITSNMILCKVCRLIQTCKYGIADISDSSLNIPFELGLMYGLGKSCVILKQKGAKQPSDIQGIEYIPYENTRELDIQLKAWIKDNVK